ncbi:MAG: protein translocase subunit SecD [Puniceicoccaceae bacterium]
MSNGSVTRITITLLVLLWAAFNIFPLEDRELGAYMLAEAGADQELLAELIEEARLEVSESEQTSLYIAIRELANGREIDLTRFYPGLDTRGLPNLRVRNQALMREMLRSSRSRMRLGLDLAGGVSFTLRIADEELVGKSERERQEQVGQVVKVIGDRINGLGVSEPMIRAVSDNSVEIQLPGENIRENPEVINQLRKPARLEFRLVSRDRFIEGEPTPRGYELKVLESMDPLTGETIERPLWVRILPEATGEIISRARVGQTGTGTYKVSMEFTSEGDSTFADITDKIATANTPNNIGLLAIVLDGKLYSAPQVQRRIRGGAEITGSFSLTEALELANVLNNPLATELRMEEMVEVGPSLAASSREKSVQAGLYGITAVILLMLAYYGVGGFLAIFSVLANVVMVIGILASIGATLTLPGVAALVLTVGMAVDANILILERIREELVSGKSIGNAVKAGFEKVFSTIVDANVTTLITALILFYLGNGPVKGFGLTLAIGIAASAFCALVLTRFLVEVTVFKLKIERLLLLNLFPAMNLDFLKLRKPAFAFSWVLVLAGLVSLGVKGKDVLGIDFLGGEEIVLSFTSNPGIEAIESLAAREELGEVQVAVQTSIVGGAAGAEKLKIQTVAGMGETFAELLATSFPESGLELVGQTTVGAAVSSETTVMAVVAISVGLVMMLLYVALRFEVGFGLGALVATIHDVLMSIGIFVILGGEFTAPMIAAVLMIMGYSINDTIVAFDRMREELELHPEWGLARVINYSINRVFSRTILTSVTTFAASFLLWIFAAGVIEDFALVFMIGLFTGTFSSIFIASPILFWYHHGDRKSIDVSESNPTYEWQTGSSN